MPDAVLNQHPSVEPGNQAHGGGPLPAPARAGLIDQMWPRQDEVRDVQPGERIEGATIEKLVVETSGIN